MNSNPAIEKLQYALRQCRAELKPIKMTMMLRQLMGNPDNSPEMVVQGMVRCMETYEADTDELCEGEE
jgi:hypothetical protein